MTIEQITQNNLKLLSNLTQNINAVGKIDDISQLLEDIPSDWIEFNPIGDIFFYVFANKELKGDEVNRYISNNHDVYNTLSTAISSVQKLNLPNVIQPIVLPSIDYVGIIVKKGRLYNF